MSKASENTENVKAEPTYEELLELEKKKLEEYVSVYIPADKINKDDVYICVNGQNCVVKRGVHTQIKRKFALVLQESQMQDERTIGYVDELTDDED